MKTPRDILFYRHQSADANLDQIRRRIGTSLTSNPEPALETSFADKLWRELIWPCRRIWAGLAATWLAILTVNLAYTGNRPTVTAKSAALPGEMRLGLQERRRVLAEIIGSGSSSSPAEPPRRPNTQPRSQLRSVATA